MSDGSCGVSNGWKVSRSKQRRQVTAEVGLCSGSIGGVDSLETGQQGYCNRPRTPLQTDSSVAKSHDFRSGLATRHRLYVVRSTKCQKTYHFPTSRGLSTRSDRSCCIKVRTDTVTRRLASHYFVRSGNNRSARGIGACYKTMYYGA